ncbi:MAG: hypothetical protein IJ618_00265 [Prevotella sp.]|nr:hypothetical protein [Prevotella sp.]
MTNPSPSFLMKQLINRVAALYLHEHPNCSIDDLAIAAATPAIHTKYKEIDPKDMYFVMLRMKSFVSRHSRFKNFKKEAAAEGLRTEWLPTLEEDDKVMLLENLMFVDYVDDDGRIVPDTKYYDNFVKLGIKYGDTTQYGNQPYSPLQQKLNKTKVTSLEPDKSLEEKLKPYIEWYKKWLRKNYMYNHEHYKWVATAQFKSVISSIDKLDEDNLSGNLEKALARQENLLSAPHYYAKQVLLKAAKIAKEDVRCALLMLFEEDKPLGERADEFINQMHDIVESHKADEKSDNTFGLKETSQQDMHAVSVYLSFMYPDRHYIFKSSVWYDFVDIVGLSYPSLSVYTHRLLGYEDLCGHIRKVLLADKDLIDLHNNEWYNGSDAEHPQDISDYHLLTQDFIYAIGVHFVDFNKRPAYFEEGRDEE